tara:strand:- start:57 stop:341 length:285 start_codon:yes stop_codon:yes gene_type:complete
MHIYNKYNNMTSIIFNINQIDKIDYSEITQTGPDDLQYSIYFEPGDFPYQKTYVTWTGMTEPSFVSSIIGAEGPYNEDQLLEILEDREWLLITE